MPKYSSYDDFLAEHKDISKIFEEPFTARVFAQGLPKLAQKQSTSQSAISSSVKMMSEILKRRFEREVSVCANSFEVLELLGISDIQSKE